jgi:hypothetical protein
MYNELVGMIEEEINNYSRKANIDLVLEDWKALGGSSDTIILKAFLLGNIYGASRFLFKSYLSNPDNDEAERFKAMMVYKVKGLDKIFSEYLENNRE